MLHFGLLKVSENSTYEEVIFKSSLFGSMSAKIFIPPNTIDFEDIFTNFAERLEDSHLVLGVLVGLSILYIVAAILAFIQDRRDAALVRFLCIILQKYLVLISPHF